MCAAASIGPVSLSAHLQYHNKHRRPPVRAVTTSPSPCADACGRGYYAGGLRLMAFLASHL
jgi:hypothetical protein